LPISDLESTLALMELSLPVLESLSRDGVDGSVVLVFVSLEVPLDLLLLPIEIRLFGLKLRLLLLQRRPLRVELAERLKEFLGFVEGLRVPNQDLLAGAPCP